jgi:hypothetical protein
MRGYLRLLLTATLSVVTAVPAAANLTIPWWTIDGGGTTSAGGASLRLSGTIGQPDAGLSSSGTLSLAGGFWMGGRFAAAIGEETEGLSSVFDVSGGVPNPFRWASTVTIDLPEARSTEARIHDSTGREIRRFAMGLLTAGRHTIHWNGTDDRGRKVPSGIYLFRIQAGAAVERRTLVLIR